MKSAIEAIEHLKWTFDRSPQAAKEMEHSMRVMLTAYYDAVEKAYSKERKKQAIYKTRMQEA